jgi:hypothetical protein
MLMFFFTDCHLMLWQLTQALLSALPARRVCGLAGGRGWQECVVSTFFIFEAAHGGPKLATFWHPATSLPTSADKSNPLKTNILYSMSRRVICPAQGRISRAAAPNQAPPSLPVFAKNY